MQFDFIAPYYDFISKLVFGDILEKAKVSQFSNISNGSKVLIIGGGSGSSLVGLLKDRLDIQIDFVEPSNKMIFKAKRRIGVLEDVNFYNVNIENFDGVSYDFVITEFFFDLIDKEEILILIKTIGQKLNNNGKWIDTDFRVTQRLMSRITLKIMYLFFRITSGVVVQKLISTKSIFNQVGFEINNEQNFKEGFISSRLIIRP